jgi:hypothetical protein
MSATMKLKALDTQETSSTQISSTDSGCASSPGHPVVRDPITGLPLTRGEAARILQQRCPACFSSKTWGRSYQSSVVHLLVNPASLIPSLAVAATVM